MKNNFFYKKDAWLSECLGVSCFNVSFSGECDRLFFPDVSPIFITAKVFSQDQVSFDNLIELGFRSINQQLTFVKNISKNDRGDTAIFDGFSLERCSFLADADKFSQLFVYDRFSADDHLPKRWSASIKSAWMNNLNGEKEFVIVLLGDKPVGFVLFDLKTVCTIDLVCLLDDFRGMGLAKAMICEVQNIALENGIYRLIVGTQKNNLASISLYKKTGFIFENEKIVLHYSEGLK